PAVREVFARQLAGQDAPPEVTPQEERQRIAGQDRHEADGKGLADVQRPPPGEVPSRDERDVLGNRQPQAAEQQDSPEPGVRTKRREGRQVRDEPLHVGGFRPASSNTTDATPKTNRRSGRTLRPSQQPGEGMNQRVNQNGGEKHSRGGSR